MDLKKMFFEKNEGKVDRVVRVVAGAVLLFAFTQGYVEGWANYIVLLLGLVGLYTGLVGHCLIYTLLGIRTDK